MPFNAELCDQAGLTPGDIAVLLDVNRVTVSRWFNGHTQPHKVLHRRVERLMARISSAYDENFLPLPTTTKSMVRQRKLIEILFAGEPD